MLSTKQIDEIRALSGLPALEEERFDHSKWKGIVRDKKNAVAKIVADTDLELGALYKLRKAYGEKGELIKVTSAMRSVSNELESVLSKVEELKNAVNAWKKEKHGGKI